LFGDLRYKGSVSFKVHPLRFNYVYKNLLRIFRMQDLFRRLQQRTSTGEEHTVKLSYLEVYNETVKDLLAPGRPLVLRDGEQVRLRSQGMLLGCDWTC
jgi:hypothetical protein